MIRYSVKLVCSLDLLVYRELPGTELYEAFNPSSALLVRYLM